MPSERHPAGLASEPVVAAAAVACSSGIVDLAVRFVPSYCSPCRPSASVVVAVVPALVMVAFVAAFVAYFEVAACLAEMAVPLLLLGWPFPTVVAGVGYSPERSSVAEVCRASSLDMYPDVVSAILIYSLAMAQFHEPYLGTARTGSSHTLSRCDNVWSCPEQTAVRAAIE